MSRRRPLAVVLSAIPVALCMCIPSLGPGDSLITSPRILAVRAVPAEAAPGTKVTFTSFIASPAGTVSAAPVQWSFCTAPTPLIEDNVVSNVCLTDASLTPAGAGPAITAATPRNGCFLFGPDTPPGGFRPTDPDSTGGYYQPLRADLTGAETAFALARIHCDLANADATAASLFAARYVLNANPTLLPLTATIGGAPASFTAIPAGASVALHASWPASAAETFAYYDPTAQVVTSQREAMQVAWYSTAGTLSTEATGRASSDPATTSDNTWTAPGAGTARLFVVLRDSRGGVDFADVEITTR